MRTLYLFLLAALSIILSSCAQTRNMKTTIYKDRRIEIQIERLVGPEGDVVGEEYSHPITFSVENLRYILKSIRYEEKSFIGWADAKAVFSADELYCMTPHLVQAFAKATPADEIVFSSEVAKKGMILSSQRFTDGRMFVVDRKLNCLFGNINIRPDISGTYDGNPKRDYGGALSKLVPNDWQEFVVGERGIHYNWIDIDIEVALNEKENREEALRESMQRRRVIKKRRLRESADWEEWEVDEAIEIDPSQAVKPSEK